MCFLRGESGFFYKLLTLILLTWTIWRAPTNASKWRMGFNSTFKGLNHEEVEWPILTCRRCSQNHLGIWAFMSIGLVWTAKAYKLFAVSAFLILTQVVHYIELPVFCTSWITLTPLIAGSLNGHMPLFHCSYTQLPYDNEVACNRLKLDGHQSSRASLEPEHRN